MEIQDIIEFLKGGAIPTITMGALGWFFKREITRANDSRVKLFDKVDSIKENLSAQDKEMALIKQDLHNHIEADEKVQKHIDKSITDIKRQLKVA